jgi:hypothetical protein
MPSATPEVSRPPAPVIRTLIHTKERRYLFEEVGALERFLNARGSPIEYVPGRPETQITTVYLDSPEGTWSAGRTRTKFRCKSYQDPNQFWFEVKRRNGVKVDKWRQPIAPPELPPVMDGSRRGSLLRRFVGETPLVPIVAVRYRRIAYEWGDLRLTIDRDVSFFAVEPADPWRIGRALGRKAGFVVEVKRDGGIPPWLRPALGERRRQRFSKSRWALRGSRHGRARRGACRSHRRISRRRRADRIRTRELGPVLAWLVALGLEGRIEKLGLRPDRADVIVVAGRVLATGFRASACGAGSCCRPRRLSRHGLLGRPWRLSLLGLLLPRPALEAALSTKCAQLAQFASAEGDRLSSSCSLKVPAEYLGGWSLRCAY